jgi:hypothetical protein
MPAAGHYVPNLAWEIVLGNKRAQEAESAAGSAAAAAAAAVSPGKGFINLQGFFVGNAWTDPAIDNEGVLSSMPLLCVCTACCCLRLHLLLSLVLL